MSILFFFCKESDPDARRTAMRLYIAHNLHFYTTILVVFLRIMAKLNLTACSEGQKNLLLLGRVLEVYTSEVMDHIRSLSEGFVQWLGRVLPSATNVQSPSSSNTPGRVRFVPIEGLRGQEVDSPYQTPKLPRQSRSIASSASDAGAASTGSLVTITNEEIKLIKQHVRLFYEQVYALFLQ